MSLSDAAIIAIRDEHLPSQGEPFDCLAFGQAVAKASRAEAIAEAAATVRKYLVYDSQRAVSWHKIQDCLEAISALADA